MKTTKMLTFLVVALGMVCSRAEISEAAPMSTAFTYQGRLMDGNGPSDGLYDLQFTLYDDANTIIGNKIGSDVNWPDVDVIDGYFTVMLDFNDPNAFTGDSRWLEVVVRPGDSSDANDFVALVPRQELTPTPYALYARTAGNALNGSGTTNRIAKFTGPNTLGDSALYEHNYYVGVGTTNPRGMFDVDCDGGNIYLDTFSSQIYIGDVDGDGDETLFTVDDGYRKFTFENGKVGIGTTTPRASLEVTNNGADYSGHFEQTGPENTNGGLNVTTTAGQYGAKILNQGGNSDISYGLDVTTEKDTGSSAYGIRSTASHNNNFVYGLRVDANSTNSYAYGGYFRANAGGHFSRGLYIDADNTKAIGGVSYGIESYSTCTNGYATGLHSVTRAGAGSTSELYGIYSDGAHLGTAGISYGIWSWVNGSDTGDSYGIYSVGKKNPSDTAGTAYGGYFIGDNDRAGGDSYGLYTTATGANGNRYGLYSEVTTSNGPSIIFMPIWIPEKEHMVHLLTLTPQRHAPLINMDLNPMSVIMEATETSMECDPIPIRAMPETTTQVISAHTANPVTPAMCMGYAHLATMKHRAASTRDTSINPVEAIMPDTSTATCVSRELSVRAAVHSRSTIRLIRKTSIFLTRLSSRRI
jgi:hypothetical protein